MNTKICLSIALITGLAACTSDRIDQTSNYWQRTETQSALYMTGPKAQHTLHQDIARCVSQLKELQRLSSLRNAIPTDTGNQIPDYNPSNMPVASEDTPQRDGPLYAEYYDFVDFEGCMRNSGWERALVMTPRQSIDGRDNYIRSLIDKDWGGYDSAPQIQAEDPQTGVKVNSADMSDPLLNQ